VVRGTEWDGELRDRRRKRYRFTIQGGVIPAELLRYLEDRLGAADD